MHPLFSFTFLIVLLAASFVTLPLEAADSKKLADTLELRGYTRIGGALEFSVHNKETKRSEWLRVGEEQHGYRIDSYDPRTNSIVIRYQGQTGTLLLQASRIADYVEPVRAPPAKAAPPIERPARPVAEERPRPESAAGASTPAQPAVPPSRQGSLNRGNDERLTYMSGSGRSSSPSSPTSPPQETPAPNEENSAASYWREMSSPPPLPSAPPPNYSPKR